MDAELRDVERRLRANRPALTPLELDAIKVRTMAATRKSRSPFSLRRGDFMKSRLALVLVLALGVFMSGTGASLAVSSINSSSASSVQYNGEKGHHSVLGKSESGGNTPSSPSSSPAPVAEVEPVAEEAVTQPLRQVSTSGGSTLPFTGFLAIPVLIVGLGLLGAGAMMRLRTRSREHS